MKIIILYNHINCNGEHLPISKYSLCLSNDVVIVECLDEDKTQMDELSCQSTDHLALMKIQFDIM